jgi:hypothetical protein
MKVAGSETMRPLPACWNNVSILQWRARQQTRLVSLTDSTPTPRLVALVPPTGVLDILKKIGDKSDQNR